MKRISPIWILLAILILGAVFRLVFLQSIPPYQVDEGSWNIGARDKILEGDWCYHIRKFCAAPVHEVMFYLWFLIWSPSLLAARILSAILGIASIVLVYLIGRKLFTVRAGLIAAYIFAINSIIILYSRKAMLESDMVFWLLLSFLLFSNRKVWSRALAGIIMALAIGTKLYAFKMLLVFGVYEVLLFWDEGDWRHFRALVRQPFLVFLATTALGTALIFGTVLHYYPVEFAAERSSYAAPFSLIPKLFGRESLTVSAKYYALRDGPTILLALLTFLFLVFRWRHDKSDISKRLNRNAVFLVHWTWIIFLTVVLMRFQPPRYHCMEMPAYILLAAVFIDRELFQIPQLVSVGVKGWKRFLGWSVLAILLLFTLGSLVWFYLIKGNRNTSAPEALAWVNKNIPSTASIGADYYMAVSLPHNEIFPLHPQRYYTVSPGKKPLVDDYFVDPFGLPNYYTTPIPGHFRDHANELPDYVLLPVNHGDTGGRARFGRFMRSPKFVDNFLILKEFVDKHGHRTILYIRKSLSGPKQ
jgi:hypothetical protein